MQAAQQVQRLLAPEAIHALPGLNISIAFLPAREVGGDARGAYRRRSSYTVVRLGFERTTLLKGSYCTDEERRNRYSYLIEEILRVAI
jgi:hypothetical protein